MRGGEALKYRACAKIASRLYTCAARAPADAYAHCGPPLSYSPLFCAPDYALLCSDGQVVLCGRDTDGQGGVPELEPGTMYIVNGAMRDMLLQILVEGRRKAVCRDLLTGDIIATWAIEDSRGREGGA